jgi:2-polyprenyl-3-methyl-5-hydroxy-6-metoxy-1,4-benzoquinol methylase
MENRVIQRGLHTGQRGILRKKFIPTLKPKCLICGSRKFSESFPWSFFHAETLYFHYRCHQCLSVFLSPLPDEKQLRQLYERLSYHDIHYTEINIDSYKRILNDLLPTLPAKAKILDYGCGSGWFLKLAREAGLDAFGVEMGKDIAESASKFSASPVYTLEAFFNTTTPTFDVIHMGDVLEHLPDPCVLLRRLISKLSEGGILSIDGPLEENPSPVLWVSRFVGFLKFVLLGRPNRVGDPFHLIRFTEGSQRRLIENVGIKLKILKWTVYETGWPYSDGGVIKKFISKIARLLGGSKFGSVTLGNRITIVLQKIPTK